MRDEPLDGLDFRIRRAGVRIFFFFPNPHHADRFKEWPVDFVAQVGLDRKDKREKSGT
jgi:hypothetical protein